MQNPCATSIPLLTASPCPSSARGMPLFGPAGRPDPMDRDAAIAICCTTRSTPAHALVDRRHLRAVDLTLHGTTRPFVGEAS